MAGVAGAQDVPEGLHRPVVQVPEYRVAAGRQVQRFVRGVADHRRYLGWGAVVVPLAVAPVGAGVHESGHVHRAEVAVGRRDADGYECRSVHLDRLHVILVQEIDARLLRIVDLIPEHAEHMVGALHPLDPEPPALLPQAHDDDPAGGVGERRVSGPEVLGQLLGARLPLEPDTLPVGAVASREPQTLHVRPIWLQHNKT